MCALEKGEVGWQLFLEIVSLELKSRIRLDVSANIYHIPPPPPSPMTCDEGKGWVPEVCISTSLSCQVLSSRNSNSDRF